MTMRMLGLLLILVLGVLAGGCTRPSLEPIAAFTINPVTGMSPLAVTFDATSSQAPGGTIAEYSWDFGDGTAGYGVIAAHSYQTDVERTFTVTLQVTDNTGQQDTSTGEVDVTPATSEVPQAAVAFVWPFHYDAFGDDAANLNDEYFTLENMSDESVDLSGWSVENERGVSFRIPTGVTLAPGALLYIHSGSGVNSPGILYWGASEPIWNNTSDLAVLSNAEGVIVDVYPYASCKDSG